MKKRRFNLPVILALVLSLVISGSVLQATPVYAADKGIRGTDVTEASDGNMLVYIDGKFVCEDIQTVLDRINAIRLEACREGVWDPRNKAKELTEADYVPVVWSNELEWIAQTRAAEAELCVDHVRPNGTRCFTATYGGVSSQAENLAWNATNVDTDKSVNFMRGIEQWYDEKDDWVNTNLTAVTGHYEILINPNVRSIGIGAFRCPDSDLGCVAGEFSADLPLSSSRVNAEGPYRQVIEIDASTLDTIPQDSFSVIEGETADLNGYFTSTYQDTTCPYVDDAYVTLPVTPLDLVWKSADESVAKVDQNGIVTGIKEGSTTVSAVSGSKSVSFFVSVSAYDPRTDNTDTDVGDIDGEYTFTGDGDWYGYESYLNYDRYNHVAGRIYMVTLPEDGRLQIEISGSGNSWTRIEASVNLDAGNYNMEQTWYSGEGTYSLNETSDILGKGTHRVIFSYPLDGYEYPGKNYFFHKITFKALNSDEKTAFSVIKKIKALGNSYDLTISDEAAVKAARNAYNALTDTQKKYVTKRYTNKLSDCESSMAVIKEQYNVKNATVTGIAAKVYTGNNLTQTPVVKLSGRTLVRGTDYKLTYKNNKSVGTATVTISGIGKYSGSISKSFRINPKPTTMKSVIAKSKGFLAKWTKKTVQITGYQLQYATNSKFTSGKVTKTYSSYNTVSKKITKLKAKKKYYVRIRTYKKVNGTMYYSAWSKATSVKTKK